MKNLFAILFFFVSQLALAHHATATNFTREIISATGVVEQVRFQNPHSSILIKVTNEDGGQNYWLIESDAKTTYERKGWDLDTIRIGSEITVSGRKGRRNFTMYLTEALMEDGTVFTSDGTE
jgi:hypothetical protein